MNEPLMENLIDYISLADNLLPPIWEIVSLEKIKNFLNEDLPELSDEEFYKILNYISPQKKQLFGEKSMKVITEIEFNIVNLTNESQVERYLDIIFRYIETAISKIRYNFQLDLL